MEWCCSLDRRTNEGGKMRRPDRGAKSCVGGVASSSAHPRGEKTEGKEEAAETGRELYISDAHGVHRARATREKHLIRSLSRILQIRSHFPTPQSHIPPDPRLSVFPSAADKTSSRVPFQNSL